MIKGIDVSRYNDDNNEYKTEAKGCDFIIIKAGEGRRSTNTSFEEQLAWARAEGDMAIGTYYWLRPGNIKAQARWYAEKANPRPDEFMSCDWERQNPKLESRDPTYDEYVEFVEELQRLCPNAQVDYMNKDFWETRAKKRRAGDALWLAWYTKDEDRVEDYPGWTIWQYAEDPDYNWAKFDSAAEMKAWARGIYNQRSGNSNPPKEVPVDLTGTASKVIDIALDEEGYREGRNNDNKYGRAYGANYTAWCAQFVWWCMREAGATGLLPKTAWCPDVLLYARNNGLILRDPVKGDRTSSGFKPGDVGLIQRKPGEAGYSKNGAKHIFFVVEDLGNGVVRTIEGNTSDSGSAQGDGVYSLKRKLTDQIVILRPKYKAEPAAPPAGGGGGSKPEFDDDMEEFLMAADWKRHSTTQKQKLAKLGQWQYLKITNANNISLAEGPARITGHVALIIHGKPGESVYFRVVEDELGTKGDTRRRATYSDHQEITITPGSTYAKFPINLNAGAASKGWAANYIRIQWHSSDPNCEITRAEVARWAGKK